MGFEYRQAFCKEIVFEIPAIPCTEIQFFENSIHQIHDSDPELMVGEFLARPKGDRQRKFLAIVA